MYGLTRRDVVTFVDRLEACDIEGAVQQTMELFESGVSVDDLVTGLLAPAQRDAGDRWEAGEWTVAQEHQATTVVDACLSALGTTEPRNVRPAHDFVVVATVEGDWHACPARMVAESLRAHGWRVNYLGGSVPAARLRRAVKEGPSAVLLSCTMTAALPGAARCIDAVRDSGVPVIVGGAAFGDDGERALRLGASGWARNITDVRALLDVVPEELPEGPAGKRERAAAPVYERLDLERAHVACEIVDSLLLSCPVLAACSETELRDIRTNAEHMIGALVAGALLSDEHVFADYVEWMDHATRFQPQYHPSTHDMLDAIAEVLAKRMPLPNGVFHAARMRLVSTIDAPDASPLYDARSPSMQGRTPMENDNTSPQLPNRLDEAAESIRLRAQHASASANARAPEGATSGEAIARLRDQADRLRRGTAGPDGPRVAAIAQAGDEARTNENGGNARAGQVVEAARAQAARLIDEAERDAAKARAAAHDEAMRIVNEAQVSAAEVVGAAEAEALELLAEAGRQVLSHLDETEADAARIVATARAEAARVTADASRVHADMTAVAAETVQHAQQEAERVLAQAESNANAIVAKARSEASAILADANAERTRLAEEAERLAAEASELLEVRLNEVETARAEAAAVRAAADAAIEADSRRLLGEAQADCDRILAEAQAEADRILAAARTSASGEIDLRAEGGVATEAAAVAAVPMDADATEHAPRRRRFRS